MGALWQSNANPAEHSVPGLSASPSPSVQRPPPRSPWRRALRRTFWLTFVLVVSAVGWLAYEEIQTATYQSRELSRYAATLSYQLADGPSSAIRFPEDGPFDKRLGYAYLPQMLERLQQRDYQIEQQTRFSPALLNYSQHGFFVPYPEKLQSGLASADCRGLPLYGFTYPQQLYAGFADIPPLVVNSLLFIENRDLLDNQQPLSNPAVDWPRFAMAALTQVGKKLDVQGQSAGGSTLATQLKNTGTRQTA